MKPEIIDGHSNEGSTLRWLAVRMKPRLMRTASALRVYEKVSLVCEHFRIFL